jgi:hypothetical protein
VTPRTRQAALAATAVLALAVVCAVSWNPRPGAAARPPDAPVPRTPARAPEVTPASAPSPGPDVRNVFEFADRAPAPAAVSLPPIAVPPPLDLQPAAIVEPVSPIRLVGFVRKGGRVRAVLSLSGAVTVLAAGEEADGYAVIAIDEDNGVTVRTPDGSEELLPPPGP